MRILKIRLAMTQAWIWLVWHLILLFWVSTWHVHTLVCLYKPNFDLIFCIASVDRLKESCYFIYFLVFSMWPSPRLNPINSKQEIFPGRTETVSELCMILWCVKCVVLLLPWVNCGTCLVSWPKLGEICMTESPPQCKN